MAAVLTAGNFNYNTVSVDDVSGVWTAVTGPSHPAGPNRNVLFGNGFPNTSYTTLRSYATGTFYATSGEGAGCVGLTGGAGAPVVTPIVSSGVTVGFELKWILADGNHDIEFRQIVAVEGPVNGTENVNNSAIRETHVVTNLGGAPYPFGLRKMWDFEIDSNDGPWLGDCSAPTSACFASVQLAPGAYPQRYVMNPDPATSTCPPPLGCTGFDLEVARRQAQITLSGANLLLNGSWCVPTGRTTGDLHCDGCVNGADLGLLLGTWKPNCCP